MFSTQLVLGHSQQLVVLQQHHVLDDLGTGGPAVWSPGGENDKGERTDGVDVPLLVQTEEDGGVAVPAMSE